MRQSRWLTAELIWLYHFLLGPFVVIFIAAFGADTSRAKIGMLVTGNTYRNPELLADMARTLDHVSGGRVVLGIGTGWNDAEMENYGIRFPERWAVCEERIHAMRAIWTHDVAEYHGEHVDFDPLWCWPKPAQRGGPPPAAPDPSGQAWTHSAPSSSR